MEAQVVREHIKKLKQEKSEMDDFEEEKNFGSKGKILRKVQYLFNFLSDTLAKMSQSLVAYSFVSEHSKHFFYVENKTCILKRGRPTPLSAPLVLKYGNNNHNIFKIV